MTIPRRPRTLPSIGSRSIGASLSLAPADVNSPPSSNGDGRKPESVHTAEFTTRAVRAGIAADLEHGAVVPPIHLSSTFAFESFGKQRTYDYTRSGNPTRAHLAAIISELEGGAGAVVTSSGMSAVALVLQALVKPGDVVIAAHDCYGGTHRILRALAARGHFEVDFVDLSDGAACWQSLARGPRLVWVETPSNPLLRITDIQSVCEAAHFIGSLVVVDNTFLSPALQRPMELGADIVVHSTTKYLNGHSDVVGGAVVARTSEVAQEFEWWANCLGVAGAPFDSYLTLRGVRTLSARMRVHEENAGDVADLLTSHPAVERVYYPGLLAHAGHALARKQQLGFGAMISFEVKGDQKAVEHVVHSLRHFTLAESLGGVESLIAHPATMTHASMGPEARERAGISDSLLRLSVGIEAAEDLCADLRHSLDGVEC
jgi:cystathionine gamma-synthase